MKLFLFSIFSFLIIISFELNAQQTVCGFDVYNKHLKSLPGYAEKLQLMEQKISEKRQQIEAQQKIMQNLNVLPGPLYEVPVVVHVVHRASDALGSAANPTDAQIQTAIDRLNANYAAASGSGNVGASAPIRFALAKRGPDCLPTSGIERFDGSAIPNYVSNGVAVAGSGATGADENDIKNLSTWPEKSYYNIWIVWRIAASGTGTTTGYATLPINGATGEYHAFPKEGMMIIGSVINGTSTTLTHEMGHAFGLYHTFEGGSASTCPPNGDCNTDGDKVCDTDPVRNLLTVGCPANTDINPCTGTNYNTAQSNLMGYGSCLNRFTNGQSDRMMAALMAVRTGFISSEATKEPPATLVTGTDPPGPTVNSGNDNDMGPCITEFGSMRYTSYGYTNDGDSYYVDNTCNIGSSVMPEDPLTLSVTTVLNRQRCKVWIDKNNSGTFTADELAMTSSTPVGLTDYTHTVIIPPTFFSGAVENTRVRVRVMADFLGSPDFQPTSALQFGQTEDFWINLNTALPVQFGTLSALHKNDELRVHWTTTSEKNNAHFLIEGSIDGNYFSTLAKMDSKAENGNSDAPLEYVLTINKSTKYVAMGGLIFLALCLGFRRKMKMTFVLVIVSSFYVSCYKKDISSSGANNKIKYIRIAQVDIDGNKKYSKTINVSEQ